MRRSIENRGSESSSDSSSNFSSSDPDVNDDYDYSTKNSLMGATPKARPKPEKRASQGLRRKSVMVKEKTDAKMKEKDDLK